MANWMAKAFNPANKGALHRELGVPQGQTIPMGRLKSAAGAKGKLGARARLAITAGNISRANAKGRSLK
jgi:hypothetical protein